MARISIAHPIRNQFSSAAGNWKESTIGLIGKQFQLLASQYPRLYLVSVSCFASLGYAYFLLFPILVLISSYAVFKSLSGYQSLAIEQLLIQIFVLVISAVVTYRIIRFRTALPQSTVKRTRQPSSMLFELVDNYVCHYRSDKINRIVFTADFELDIVKIPRWSIPIWSSTTLIIGIPVLQCFSVTRFQCALARRIGQFSRRRKWKGNLLYQLRNIWSLYSENGDHPSFGYQPVSWFYSVFASIYRIISAPVARTEELAADTCAMDLFSDDDVLDLITVQMACHRYLEDECLPAMHKIQADHSMTADGIASGTVSLICKLIHSDRMVQWVTKAGSAEPRLDDTLPTLAMRVQNIGHVQPRMHVDEPESAASIYLACAG